MAKKDIPTQDKLHYAKGIYDYLTLLVNSNEPIFDEAFYFKSNIDNENNSIEAQKLDMENAKKQIASVKKIKDLREQNTVNDALEELRIVCKSDENVMDSIINAVKVGATVGEINSIMREVFGTWISPSGV